MDREFLKLAGQAIKEKLPDNYAFILLAAPIGTDAGDNRLVYISSMDRESAINVLKAWLIQASGPEEWMTHIK